MPQPYTLPETVRIGHVHLRVADLDRALAFYCDLLGFTLKVDGRASGLPIAFLAAGAYHHHVALNATAGPAAVAPPPGHTGLHHVAIVYPDRVALARAVARLVYSGRALDGARDHRATVSVYLKDPDQNGIELYYDRPYADWFDGAGRLIVQNDSFDPATLVDGVAAPAEAGFAV
jgi:catechol 2,3-dioxygenase